MSDADSTARADQDLSTDEARIRWWFGQFDAARKREKEFRTEGAKLVEIFEGEKRDTVPFNILYSNTETLAPAVYNSTPRPVVKPRYKSNDPLPQAAAKLCAQFLDYIVDTGDSDEAEFDQVMQDSLTQGLVPGRGLSRLRYSASTKDDADGTPRELEGEYVCLEVVDYNRVLMGYAKRWKEVPWIAFEIPMTKDEVTKLLGPEAAKGTYTARDRSDEDSLEVKDSEGVSLYWVYQVWDKVEREFFYLVEGVKDQFFKKTKDPLGLDSFYPTPEPLTFLTKISSLTPRAIYSLYENQARELNQLTLRIKAIIASIKATGGYNPMIDGLDKILEFEDGKLAPLQNLQSMGDGASVDKAVWVWPADKFITVLQQLYLNREQVKQVIYEITGISDILRGSSVASETATAQNLKNQWGSLRIKRFQKRMTRFVKENLRLTAELGFKKLKPETIKAMTGSSLPMRADKAKAQAQVQAMQAQAQAAALMAPPGSPPPQPPQIPPELQAVLAMPVLEDVVDALKSDLQRSYLIDIETNSTVDAEATEDKANVVEFLTAIGQFFSGIGPLVENGTVPFPAAKMMLLTISRKFRLGRELDDEIASMQAPQGQGGAQAAEMMKKVEEQMKALAKERQAVEDAKLKVKEQQLQANFEAQAAELSKNLALKEVEMSKKLALAEVQGNAKLAARELELEEEASTTRQTLLEEGAHMRLGFAGEDVQKKAGEVATKAKEVESADPSKLALEAIKPIVEAMAQGILEGFQALAKQMSAPRVARKGPDGVWRGETETPKE